MLQSSQLVQAYLCVVVTLTDVTIVEGALRPVVKCTEGAEPIRRLCDDTFSTWMNSPWPWPVGQGIREVVEC